MSVISESLSRVRIGNPTTIHNLTMFPLIRTEQVEASYLTLVNAIAKHGIRLTEVSDSGSVPELKVTNALERPVLLVDGEELVGAKQNRVLNLSILVPARAELLVPVSCVEAGRWQHTSPEFKSAGRAQYAAGRAARVSQVSDSLAARGSRASDQSEVWSNIASKARRMAVNSETSAMSDIYRAHESKVADYVAGLSPVEGQVGAVFATDGRIVGLDIFDAETTLTALLPTLVRSHALDAIESKSDQQSVGPGQVLEFVELIGAAATTPYAAIGLGEDLRFSNRHVNGAALSMDGTVVHLCAYATLNGKQTTAALA